MPWLPALFVVAIVYFLTKRGKPGAAVPPAAPREVPGEPPRDPDARIQDLVRAGKTVEAIILYRETYRADLTQAKTAIDRIKAAL